MNSRIDLRFLVLAVILLLSGITLGIVMGVKQDFELVPVHAHANLVGWVSIALFGLVYRSYPELAERKLAEVHFWLAAVAAVVFPLGIGLSILRHNPILAIIGSLIWAAACVVFLVQLLSLFRVSSAAAQAAE